MQLADHPSSCWRIFSDERLTWGRAAQSCISRGGHLSIEYSESVAEMISTEIVNNYGDNEHRWWIGLRNALLDEYRWSSGETAGTFRFFLCVNLRSRDDTRMAPDISSPPTFRCSYAYGPKQR